MRYAGYRDCLRWEFGFSCAFCLLHEADWVAHGAERTGLFTIEHGSLKSRDPARANDIENCFLACRYCNTSRGIHPARRADGSTLRDPVRDAWAGLFRLDRDRLRPRVAAARYTHETYDLDDPRKIRLRADRRMFIRAAWRVLRVNPGLLRAIVRRGARAALADQPEFDRVRDALAQQLRDAYAVLLRFSAVPTDAPTGCRCGPIGHRTLPGWIDAQTSELTPPI